MINPAWLAGGQPANGRRKSDYYPTPPDATVALLNFLGLQKESVVWEPACGTGMMADAIKSQGYQVIASDINDYGYGLPNIDFLTCDCQTCDAIITNPPFSLAEQFIRRAARHKKPFAFLLKSQFWNARKRRGLFLDVTPSYILPLTWRPDFTGEGNSLMDVMWVVWNPPYSGIARYYPITKQG